jgi:hypothetical protein
MYWSMEQTKCQSEYNWSPKYRRDGRKWYLKNLYESFSELDENYETTDPGIPAKHKQGKQRNDSHLQP